MLQRAMYIITSILLLNLFLVVPVYGEIVRVDFKDALLTALEDNTRVKITARAIEVSEQELEIAKSGYYPKLVLQESFTRTDNSVFVFMEKLNQQRFSPEDFQISRLNSPEPVDGFQLSLSLQQPLYVPKIGRAKRVSFHLLKAAKEVFREAKEAVAYKLYRAYLDVQTAKEYLKVAEMAMEDAREHLRLARVRYEAGTGLYSDVLRAEVAIKNAEKLRVEAESRLRIARRFLGLVMGRTDEVDTLQDPPRLPLHELQLYLQAAMDAPQIKQLRAKLQAASEAIEMQRSAYLPELVMDMTVQADDDNNPFDLKQSSYRLTFMLRWNVFDRATHYKVKKSVSEAAQISEMLSGKEKEVVFQINRAYLKVEEKAKALELAEKALQEAEEAMRLVRLRYKNSLSPIVDLLDTQVVLQQARAGVVRAENEYRAAIAELYYYSGILIKELKNQITIQEERDE